MKNNTNSHFLWIIPFVSFIAGYLFIARLYRVEELNTPNVMGKSLTDALGTLSDNNLGARLLTYKEDTIVPEGTVISQSPAAAQKIKPGQNVYLVVSTRPRLCKAPNLLNKTIDEINQEFSNGALRTKSHSLPSNYPLNRCFAQFPSPDQAIEDGKIVLYISQGSQKPVIMPNLKNKKVLDAVEFLKKYPVKIEISHENGAPQDHECTSCTIVDQRPLPGTIFTLSADHSTTIRIMVR